MKNNIITSITAAGLLMGGVSLGLAADANTSVSANNGELKAEVKSDATPTATTGIDAKSPRLGTTLQDLPEKARETVLKQAGTAQISDIDKETWDGQTVYQIKLKEPGKNPKFYVAQDGSLITDKEAYKKGLRASSGSRHLGLRAGHELKDLPASVQTAVQDHAAGRKIADVDKKDRQGRTVYEVTYAQKGKNEKVFFDDQGMLINEAAGAEAKKSSKHLQLIDLPQPVQDTIKRENATGTVHEIDRETKKGQVVYQIEFKEKGPNRKLHIAEDGTLVK